MKSMNKLLFSNMTSWLSSACLLLAVTGCTGETNPRTYPVSGTVTQAGKPLESAVIVFVSLEENGQPAFATSDASGKYELMTFSPKDGALPGKYNIKVSLYDKPPQEVTHEVRNMTPEEEMKAYKPDEKTTPLPKNLLPPKYANEVTSGLTHTVGTTPSTFDIVIK